MTFENYTTDNLKLSIYKAAFEAAIEGFTEADINELYKEAYKRKLFRPDILLNMHSWSLYFLKKTNKPRHRVDTEGNYTRVG